MKLEKHGLGGKGFGILPRRTQVQTAGESPNWKYEWSMVRIISVMRVICFGTVVCCRVFVGFICFPLSVTPQIKDEVFEQVTAMCNMPFFFS